MAHSHHHAHEHSLSGDLKIAFLLNLGFTLFEIVGGLLTNSMAILSDALHDFGDSISLGLAWYLGRVSEKGSNHSYSYGYRRFSLLGAFINAVILIVGSLFILSEAIPRLFAPEPFSAGGVVLLAVIGVVVNGVAALRVRRHASLNAEMVGWHLLEDVLGWAVVLAVGVVALFVDAPILDPLLSIMITVYMLVNVIARLRAVVALFLQAVPRHIDLAAINTALEQVAGVETTHHVHVWSLDGEHNVLTAHVVVSCELSNNEIITIKQACNQVLEGFNLHLEHVTLEIEFAGGDCSMQAVVGARELAH